MRPEPPPAHDGPRLQAARYRDARNAGLDPTPVDEYEERSGEIFKAKAERAGLEVQGAPETPPAFHADDAAWEVATPSIDRAIARGDFDDLAYAGKPLPLLDSTDPDWWLKSLMQREQISGLGPPALLLRTEEAALDATLDALPGENSVREMVTDFNARILEARRQLLGGPPVITDTRDPDEEVRRWRERRAAHRPAESPAPPAGPQRTAGPWRRVWARLWPPSD